MTSFIAKAIARLFICIAAFASTAALAHANGWRGASWPSHGGGVWDISQRTARDLNPHPDIVEINLVAKERMVHLGNGVATKMWTYNGSFPGPVIEGKVGDTLIVHFVNKLPEETTVHWHGLEVPAAMDGSSISQNPVQPGETFTYKFKLLRASTYWYHPHIRGNEQVELGLQGMLIVHDPDDQWKRGLPRVEHTLVLDDILLDEHGDVAPDVPTDPLEKSDYLLNGREGNFFLVNGKIQPRAFIPRDNVQRFRLVNSANTRFMRISIPGHKVYQIGTDGGLLEEPVEIQPIRLIPDPNDPHKKISDPDLSKGLMLTPGERADILVVGIGAKPVKFIWHDVPRGRHKNAYAPDGSIMLGDDENDGKARPRLMASLKPIGPGGRHRHHGKPPSQLADIEPIDVTGARTITVELGHTPPAADGSVIFFVQRKENVGQCPLPIPMPCPLPFPMVTPADAPSATPGETVILEVNNLTGGMHNFHLHGFFFQHIETQFFDMDNPDNNKIVPAERLENKDTIRLPARTGARMRSRSVTRLAVKLDDVGREGLIYAFGKTPGEDTSGGWLFHCHILEHSRNGMTSFLQVVPEAD